jgi:hypothetical protein
VLNKVVEVKGSCARARSHSNKKGGGGMPVCQSDQFVDPFNQDCSSSDDEEDDGGGEEVEDEGAVEAVNGRREV